MPNVSEKFPFSILILSHVVIAVVVAVVEPLPELLRTIFYSLVRLSLGAPLATNRMVVAILIGLVAPIAILTIYIMKSVYILYVCVPPRL